MKTYMKPESTVIVLKNPVCLFKSSVGNEYTSTDVTYTRENNMWDIWGNNSDDED